MQASRLQRVIVKRHESADDQILSNTAAIPCSALLAQTSTSGRQITSTSISGARDRRESTRHVYVRATAHTTATMQLSAGKQTLQLCHMGATRAHA
jgi:hypothetical protein